MSIREDGYIALLTVIIVGAAAMAIALTLLLTGSDAQRSALITQQSIQARQLAHGCAEEALQVIHDSTSYTGTGTLTLGAGSCSYTVSSTGTSTRTVTTTGTVSSVIRKVTAYVTINASSISVSSWQET
jgi:type II secretory pathway component PulK